VVRGRLGWDQEGGGFPWSLGRGEWPCRPRSARLEQSKPHPQPQPQPLSAYEGAPADARARARTSRAVCTLVSSFSSGSVARPTSRATSAASLSAARKMETTSGIRRRTVAAPCAALVVGWLVSWLVSVGRSPGVGVFEGGGARRGTPGVIVAAAVMDDSSVKQLQCCTATDPGLQPTPPTQPRAHLHIQPHHHIRAACESLLNLGGDKGVEGQVRGSHQRQHRAPLNPAQLNPNPLNPNPPRPTPPRPTPKSTHPTPPTPPKPRPKSTHPTPPAAGGSPCTPRTPPHAPAGGPPRSTPQTAACSRKSSRGRAPPPGASPWCDRRWCWCGRAWAVRGVRAWLLNPAAAAVAVPTAECRDSCLGLHQGHTTDGPAKLPHPLRTHPSSPAAITPTPLRSKAQDRRRPNRILPQGLKAAPEPSAPSRKTNPEPTAPRGGGDDKVQVGAQLAQLRDHAVLAHAAGAADDDHARLGVGDLVGGAVWVWVHAWWVTMHARWSAWTARGRACMRSRERIAAHHGAVVERADLRLQLREHPSDRGVCGVCRRRRRCGAGWRGAKRWCCCCGGGGGGGGGRGAGPPLRFGASGAAHVHRALRRDRCLAGLQR